MASATLTASDNNLPLLLDGRCLLSQTDGSTGNYLGGIVYELLLRYKPWNVLDRPELGNKTELSGDLCALLSTAWICAFHNGPAGV